MAICEICASVNFKSIATEIREGSGRIAKCLQCGLVIQDTSLSEAELKDYYNEDYQQTNSLRQGAKQTPREHYEDRKQTIRGILKKIRPFLRHDMKVLEVGCGTGEVLEAIKENVAEVSGIELNEDFVTFMNCELGIEALAEDGNKFAASGRKFDLIFSIATLDHLPNPLETLISMRELLAPGGKMYIEVPNIDEAMNKYLPEENRLRFNTFFWHKAHLFYFSKDSLTAILRKAGLASEITIRHEYTLSNFLNWYYLGTRQKAFVDATTDPKLFGGDSSFETKMNELFVQAEGDFHKIMEETGGGDTLCAIAMRL